MTLQHDARKTLLPMNTIPKDHHGPGTLFPPECYPLQHYAPAIVFPMLHNSHPKGPVPNIPNEGSSPPKPPVACLLPQSLLL